MWMGVCTYVCSNWQILRMCQAPSATWRQQQAGPTGTGMCETLVARVLESGLREIGNNVGLRVPFIQGGLGEAPGWSCVNR